MGTCLTRTARLVNRPVSNADLCKHCLSTPATLLHPASLRTSMPLASIPKKPIRCPRSPRCLYPTAMPHRCCAACKDTGRARRRWVKVGRALCLVSRVITGLGRAPMLLLPWKTLATSRSRRSGMRTRSSQATSRTKSLFSATIATLGHSAPAILPPAQPSLRRWSKVSVRWSRRAGSLYAPS